MVNQFISKSLKSLLSVAILALSSLALAETAPYRIVNDSAQGPLAKTQALETLKKARDAEQEEIAKIDKDMKSKVSETQSYQASASNTAQEHAFESRWFNYAEALRIFSAKRQEALLKEKILDQIMFEIDTKWNGQGMRSFLEHSLLDMSLGEMTDSNPEINRALFFSYMSVAVREIPEKTDDLVSFLIGYMNFSSVSKPRPPLAYTNSRNYSNGSKSMTAHSLKAEAISDLVEKRLKIVEELRASNAKATGKDSESSADQIDKEDFDESKVIKPKESDKLKPSASIINIAPERVSEVLIKN